MATLLGIDYGNKKIGFATGQSITGTSSPLVVVGQNGEMWRSIEAIFQQWKPSIIVVGEPKLADGKQHPLEPAIQGFIAELTARYDVAVYRADETLTSHAASEYVTPKRTKKGKNATLDAHAAAIFLESWMRDNNHVL